MKDLDWGRDGPLWPHHGTSRFVDAAGIKWHVQEMGAGPGVLLLHGTGASTHSFAGLLPLLAAKHRVVAIDLPGHGFSQLPPCGQVGLARMAAMIRELIDAIGPSPHFLIGHSAGAAIAVRLALDDPRLIAGIVSLNGALLPFPGIAAFIFPALARLLFLNPFAASLLARRARDPAAVARLIQGTGSHIDAEGLACYNRLFQSPRHIKATIAMMARWDLRGLAAALPRLHVPLLLVAGQNDAAVPPSVADAVARGVPGARVMKLANLGHLAHEEDPARIAKAIAPFLLHPQGTSPN